MILSEATVGGVIYLEWIDSEMKLPEDQRVAFNYGVLTTRERIDLLHKTSNASGKPNGVDVCMAAIDRKGLKIKNLFGKDGAIIDTIEKCLSYDSDTFLAYMLELVGLTIWDRQNITAAQIKNSESPSIVADGDTSTPPQ